MKEKIKIFQLKQLDIINTSSELSVFYINIPYSALYFKLKANKALMTAALYGWNFGHQGEGYNFKEQTSDPKILN